MMLSPNGCLNLAHRALLALHCVNAALVELHDRFHHADGLDHRAIVVRLGERVLLEEDETASM